MGVLLESVHVLAQLLDLLLDLLHRVQFMFYCYHITFHLQEIKIINDLGGEFITAPSCNHTATLVVVVIQHLSSGTREGPGATGWQLIRNGPVI